jgi:hypothetical protein
MCSLTNVEKVTGDPLKAKLKHTKTTMDPIKYAYQLESILEYNPGLLPSALLPSKSVAVFFRMRSWVAKFVLYIIQRDEYVRDQVVRLGYRILAPLDQGPFSVICGYNIRKCPEGVGQDGVSLVDGFAPHRHRDLVDKLSREYHERVYACESAEDSGSESCSEPETPVLVSPLPAREAPTTPLSEAPGTMHPDTRARRMEMEDRKSKIDTFLAVTGMSVTGLWLALRFKF